MMAVAHLNYEVIKTVKLVYFISLLYFKRIPHFKRVLTQQDVERGIKPSTIKTNAFIIILEKSNRWIPCQM